MKTLDINLHPCNAASILSWLLMVWADDESAKPLVITTEGDGKALINRVRVKMTNARKALRKHGASTDEFGMTTRVIPWTYANGEKHEAVCFEKEIRLVHRISMILQDTKLEKVDGL